MAVSVTVKLSVVQFDKLREILQQHAEILEKAMDAAADAGDNVSRGKIYSQIGDVEKLFNVFQ